MRRIKEFYSKYFARNKTVWIYWENPPGTTMPDYIKLCHATIKYWSRGVNLQIVTPENLFFFLPNLHPNINKTYLKSTGQISLAIKTDFIRVFLLELYGGLYLDSDCLPLKRLKDMIKEINKHDFISIRRASFGMQHIPNNFLGACVGNEIIKIYAGKLRHKLETQTEFTLYEVGANLLTPIVNHHLQCGKIFPEKMAHPIVAQEQWKFMSTELCIEDILSDNTIMAMLFHDAFTGPCKASPDLAIPACEKGWLEGWDMKALYSGNILLSKLYRKSLPYKFFLELLASSEKLLEPHFLEHRTLSKNFLRKCLRWG